MFGIMSITMHAISIGAKGLAWYNRQQYETFHSQACISQGKPDRFFFLKDF